MPNPARQVQQWAFSQVRVPGRWQNIGAACAGRDNNLNLIRMVAAVSVLISHSFPLALGDKAQEPLAWTGIALGSYSLLIFFALSGFLISKSFERSQDVTVFWRARALRLLPGLFVSLGVYIYAFPVQQTLVHFFHGVSPLALMATSLPVTLVCAALSWHLVEGPVMQKAKKPHQLSLAAPLSQTTVVLRFRSLAAANIPGQPASVTEPYRAAAPTSEPPTARAG